MQVSELNSSATADPWSIEPQSQIGPNPDPDHGSQPSEADQGQGVTKSVSNASDIQATANMPALHGTTSSHVNSPHPTQAGDQVDQVITPAAGDQTRRLSIPSPKMLFSDLYKSKKSPLVRWRQHHHSQSAPAATDYDPDLVSKDKTKQKEAIKRVLEEKVRSDWHFEWTRQSAKSDSGVVKTKDTVKTQEDDSGAERTDSENDAASVYSTLSEDLVHFRSRKEWLSDMPDDSEADDPPDSPSAYRFDTPDAVGSSVKSAAIAKSAKRRKAVRDEMEWNDGLACFNARRDAWTGAKPARVRPKPASPIATSPTTRRLSFWGHLSFPSPASPTEPTVVTSPLSPAGTRTSDDTTIIASSDAEVKETKSKEDTSTFPVETLIPLPRPLLPPTTPMRASITPAAYLTIYDKIVLQSATPSCPINLNDVVRSCVTGWKRDGEWPPRSTEPPPVVAVRKRKKKESVDSRTHANRRMSFNFLGRRQSVGGDPSTLAASTSHVGKEDSGHGGKAIRKSLQRVFSLGQEKTGNTQGGR